MFVYLLRKESSEPLNLQLANTVSQAVWDPVLTQEERENEKKDKHGKHRGINGKRRQYVQHFYAP